MAFRTPLFPSSRLRIGTGGIRSSWAGEKNEDRSLGTLAYGGIAIFESADKQREVRSNGEKVVPRAGCQPGENRLNTSQCRVQA